MGTPHDDYTVLPAGHEPLPGYARYRVLDRHPAGRYTAMEAIASHGLPAAAVWDTLTGRIAYAPDAASLIGWLNGGREVLVVGYVDGASGAADAAQGAVEGDNWMERRTWPQGDLISSCQVTLFTGWPHSLVVSPHGNLAIIRTYDQDISGWDFVVLVESRAFQVVEAGFSMDSDAALCAQPGYSPDGRLAVTGYHTTFVEQDFGGIPYDVPLRQGGFEVGRITVVNIAAGTCDEIIVADAVPAALHRAAAERLVQPVFIDAEHFTVTFPTGETRTYLARQ